MHKNTGQKKTFRASGGDLGGKFKDFKVVTKDILG